MHFEALGKLDRPARGPAVRGPMRARADARRGARAGEPVPVHISRRAGSARRAAPLRSAASTRRSELDELGPPMISTASHRDDDRLHRRPSGWWSRSRCRSARGARISGNRRLSTASDRRGIVHRERGLGQEGEVARIARRRTASASSGVSTSVIDPAGHLAEGADHLGWPAWPMNNMCRPAATSRSAWRWTLETSGQVASRY